ncbi:outer membrane protein assembly factor BamD [Martelella radicis]|uniref:Outer membrane protein assembly factor BamD n=1 Tax=Martelella radicis TaxID=1397476 RepID=A0A7W6KLG7_9HYPH|nr:outer membrane protein assembly factor BamD [Martelella radicis]MBB4122299.1 outer membrane protein assembly factor BamD [Martelella radicis]
MAGTKKRTNVGAFRAATLPVAIVLGASVLLAGCSRDKDVDITTLQYEADPPQQLYDEALANISAGKTGEALRKLKSIQDQNPLSDYARQALIMQTYLQYRSRKYEAAVASGRRYLQLYPNSKDAAYAQYLVGLSYSKEIVDVTQDQAVAERTIDAMQKLIDNYPDSEYVSDARAKIRYARDQIAGKDMQVGRYYLERKDYVAAISRFNSVVNNYSDTNQIEEALERLVEAYYAMGVIPEAQNAAWVLGYNYPDSVWYQRAYNLLNKQGLEPKSAGRGSSVSSATPS